MATFFRRKAAAVTLGVLALTLAGGGIAVAQPTGKAPTSAAQPEARRPGVGAQPPVSPAAARQAKAALKASLAPPPAGTVAWAFVRADGVLQQHTSNVVSATKYSTAIYGAGLYQVILDYDVHLKAYNATVGTSDQFNVPPGGEVAVAPRYLTPNGVFIATRSATGVPADRGFYLIVTN